jgi:hypothetical protein
MEQSPSWEAKVTVVKNNKLKHIGVVNLVVWLHI